MSVEPDFSLHPDPALARAAAQDLFERTATMLRSLLPASADIRHIGATAIPGCLTKGDLDIVVRVEAADFAGADAALAALFARNTGSTHSDTFSSFESDGTSPHLGVQLTVIGAPGDFFHTFAEALTRVGSARPIAITEYKQKSVAVVSTLLPGLKPSVVDKTLRVMAERLAPASGEIVLERRVPHEGAPLATAIREAAAGPAELVVVFGASAITDRRVSKETTL